MVRLVLVVVGHNDTHEEGESQVGPDEHIQVKNKLQFKLVDNIRWAIVCLHLHIEVVPQGYPTFEGQEREESDERREDIVELEVPWLCDPHTGDGDGDLGLSDYDVKGGVNGHFKFSNAVFLKDKYDTHTYMRLWTKLTSHIDSQIVKITVIA